MFQWFNAQEELAFAEQLADFFIKELPPSVVAGGKKPKKIEQTFNKMKSMVDKFKAQRKINFYKKSKLGNAFMWKLKEAGYEEGVVQNFTEQIILRLGN